MAPKALFGGMVAIGIIELFRALAAGINLETKDLPQAVQRKLEILDHPNSPPSDSLSLD